MSPLHVYLVTPQEYEIWWDKLTDKDGILLGAGATELDALRAAVTRLKGATRDLTQRAQRLAQQGQISRP